MRITQLGLQEIISRDIQDALHDIRRLQHQISTGKRLENPSQEPLRAATLISLKRRSSNNDVYRENISAARLKLESRFIHVDTMEQRIAQAKEIALRYSGGTLDENARRGLIEELEGLIRAMVDEGRTQEGGDYLFSGTASSTNPLTTTESADSFGVTRIQTAVYSGNSSDVSISIGESNTVKVTLNAQELFGASGTGQPATLITNMISLRQAIESDSRASADTAQTAIDAHLARLDRTLAEIGARIEGLDRESRRRDELDLVLRARSSVVGDVDVAELIFELNDKQTAYQAALSAAAQNLQLNLAEFI